MASSTGYGLSTCLWGGLWFLFFFPKTIKFINPLFYQGYYGWEKWANCIMVHLIIKGLYWPISGFKVRFLIGREKEIERI